MNKKKNYIYRIIIIFSFSCISAQTMQEIQRARAEFERYKVQGTADQVTEPILEEIDPVTGLPRRAELTPYEPPFEPLYEDTLEKGLQFFGYDFFTRRDTVAFWENLPAPANYLLGPGDEMVISLWGETQLREVFTISREGNIYDQRVGLLNLMGKTIEESENYLKTQYGRMYATLNGSSPSTFLDVSLGQLRSINVNFVGDVNYPGIYPVHPFSTVITGLIQAGGVKETGSLRNIQIKRHDKSQINIDLYDYLLKGNYPKNIQLRDQDVVFIPVRNYSVAVDSFVTRPGIYEAKKDESIREIIDYAGGLTADASSLIGIKRIIPMNKREETEHSSENFYIEYENSNIHPIQNGDTITVKNIFKSLKQVEIIGQVKKPGKYGYFSGMMLSDLLNLSGGFQDTTFLKSVYQKRGELVRRDPNTRYEEVYNLDLKNIINNKLGQKIKLQNLDKVVIHANLNYFEKENVKILGEVNVPGSYPVLNDNESLQSFIDRAGGFTTKAFQDGIEIFRDTLRVAWENTGISLVPGDSVVIKQRPGVIFVTGEVYNEGLIEYREGKGLRYYINASGGITQEGNPRSILVVYANGVVIPKKWYRTSKINDGSIIIVNAKPPAEPFNITEFASNWTSIISSMITVIILSRQLTQ